MCLTAYYSIFHKIKPLDFIEKFQKAVLEGHLKNRFVSIWLQDTMFYKIFAGLYKSSNNSSTKMSVYSDNFMDFRFYAFQVNVLKLRLTAIITTNLATKFTLLDLGNIVRAY